MVYQDEQIMAFMTLHPTRMGEFHDHSENLSPAGGGLRLIRTLGRRQQRKPREKMRAALIVNPVTANRQSNLAVAVKMIREAASNGSDLVLCGEMAATGMLNNDNPDHDLPLGESIPGALTCQLYCGRP